MTSLIRDPETIYYRQIYREKILSQGPVSCGARSGPEIHILTSADDFLDALWCLHTFCRYSRAYPRIVMHSDGTLNGRHREIVSKHFRRARFIARSEADKALGAYLKGRPACLRYRLGREAPKHAIKLFDFFYYSTDRSFLMLDSDMLFFRRPAQLLACMARSRGAFLSDCADSYSYTRSKLSRMFAMPVLERVNSGLLYFPRGQRHELDLIETFLESAHGDTEAKQWCIEQTAFALLLSLDTRTFTRLAPAYQIAHRPLTASTVCHHFTGGKPRRALYVRGLKRLHKAGFLEDVLTAG